MLFSVHAVFVVPARENVPSSSHNTPTHITVYRTPLNRSAVVVQWYPPLPNARTATAESRVGSNPREAFYSIAGTQSVFPLCCDPEQLPRCCKPVTATWEQQQRGSNNNVGATATREQQQRGGSTERAHFPSPCAHFPHKYRVALALLWRCFRRRIVVALALLSWRCFARRRQP